VEWHLSEYQKAAEVLSPSTKLHFVSNLKLIFINFDVVNILKAANQGFGNVFL